MNKRTWIGIIVAPLIAPILYQLGLIIFEYESVTSIKIIITNAFLPLLFFALPVSYGATLLFGIPLIWFLKRFGILSFFSVTLCAALAGALIMATIYGPFSWQNVGWRDYFWYPIFGGFLGFSVAAVYCLITGVSLRTVENKSRLLSLIVIVFVLVYISSYFFLRANDKLFFYKEVEYYRGIAGPTVHYSIGSQTTYLHYLYYFPALIEEPFSWRDARLSVREGGQVVDNLGTARLSRLWYFLLLAIFGYYGYRKFMLRKKVVHDNQR